MAAPNLANVVTIIGKTDYANVTTVASNVTVNSGGSGKALKINTIMISNIDGTNSANVIISVFNSAVEYKLAHNIVVPAAGSLVVVSRDNGFYMVEGDYMRMTASANNRLNAVVSYEDLS